MTKIKSWKEKSREQVFKKYSRTIDKVIFELPDGSQADFYINADPQVVVVLALTTDNKVILVRQYRPGPQKIIKEMPGGLVEDGEDFIDAAKREFLEETGYNGEFELVGLCLDDAYSTRERACLVARNCQKIGEPQNSSTEQTEVVLVSLKAFRQHLRSGQLTDVEAGYLGLDYLKLL